MCYNSTNACWNNWGGGYTPAGQTVPAYSQPVVPYGSTCIPDMITCNAGNPSTFNSSDAYQSCTVDPTPCDMNTVSEISVPFDNADAEADQECQQICEGSYFTNQGCNTYSTSYDHDDPYGYYYQCFCYQW
jgi:hypothetical protein